MSIDLSKIKARLAALQTTSAKSNYQWKPSPGKNVIRIVPYAHNPENPFIELYFHYNLNGKTYLSPISFDRPDPIVEFANKLKQSQDKEEWKKGRALEPKLRTYVPIIVRGKENEGVKFWGMGKTVYEDILSLIADPDYGDITDPKTGRDITVEFKTAQECGKDYPETTIRVKPNPTPAFDITDRSIVEKVKNQKNIQELWPELSYDDLALEMDKWLNSTEGGTESDPEAVEAGESVPDVPADNTDTPSTPATKTPVKTSTSAQNAADDFDNLFK